MIAVAHLKRSAMLDVFFPPRSSFVFFSLLYYLLSAEGLAYQTRQTRSFAYVFFLLKGINSVFDSNLFDMEED